MDISFWTALNPNIVLLKSNRLMHRKYLYRLAINAPGSALLREETDLDDAAGKRNNNAARYNYGGSWRQKPLIVEDVELLKIIKTSYRNLQERVDADDIRIRIEEPGAQFYSTMEEPLLRFAETIRFQDNTHFVSIMRPQSEFARKLILDGFVIRKNATEWPYRLVLRDGKYNSELKSQLAALLKNLGDEVKVPTALASQLGKGGWIWGGYVYFKDPQLSSVFGMMDPRLIGKVEEFRAVSEEQ
jgi:hypothetical protein